MSTLSLARPELLDRSGYKAALGRFDLMRLHANELPVLDDDCEGLNRYPPPRPTQLTQRLSEVLGVPSTNILVTRGSNEGIDLLVRGFCRAGVDSIVVCPPTFGMYRISAEVQGAFTHEVPLDRDFDIDTPAINTIVDESNGTIKLIFLCSPANPTGAHVSLHRIEALCNSLAGKAVVVLDQAYIEFSENCDLLDLCLRFDNLVILRTFSKAYGLAGLRCGTVVANPTLISFLDSLLPPYSTPTPTIQGVLKALNPANLERLRVRLTQVEQEKVRLQQFLEHSPWVVRLFESDSNFVLAECLHAEDLFNHIKANNILVRSFISTPRLENCLRITVGNHEENSALFQAIETFSYDA